MAKLKVPSLQHLARNWKDDSGMISRDLVKLVKNPPRFSYNSLYSAAFDLLHFKQPIDEIIRGIEQKEKRANVRKNLLEILPIMSDHFEKVSPDFVNRVSSRQYTFGKDFAVPFTPPLVYGLGGQLYFPWFSFWRSNPLSDDNLRLFVTLVREVLDDDPDFEGIRFEVLDFSANFPNGKRKLKVIDTSEVELLRRDRAIEMLEVFVDGYNKAKAILEAEPDVQPEQRDDEEDNYSDDLQPGLFD